MMREQRGTWVALVCGLGVMAAAFSTSCATILSDNSKDVTFTSSPEGVKIRVISFDQKKQYALESPQTLRLQEDKNYIATYSLPGYYVQSIPVSSFYGDDAAAGLMAGNLILGGGIGLFVDATSGALATLPDRIDLEMTRIEEAAPLNAVSSEYLLEKIRVLSEARKAKAEQIRAENRRRVGPDRHVPKNTGVSSIGVCEVFECVEEVRVEKKCRNKKIDRACRQRPISPVSPD